MAKRCDLTGKKPMTGNHVSHSNRKIKRTFNPNLQTKRFYVPEIDKTVTLKVATSTLRTIDKKGIYAYLQELERKGLYKFEN